MTQLLNAGQIERVVVRGVNWVGDALMTVPALRALRRILPHAQITLAARGWTESLFQSADFIDNFLTLEKSGNSARGTFVQSRRIANNKFDLAILLTNSFGSLLPFALARVPSRFGYATEGRRMLLTHAITPPAWKAIRHEVFYYLNLIGELERALTGEVIIAAEPPADELHLTAEQQQTGAEFLAAAGLVLNRPLVMFCPGSTNSHAKRWHAEHYARLGEMLYANYAAQIVLVGAGDEIEVANDVARLMKAPVVSLAGKTSLAQLVAILAHADVMVSNDTGTAHIAAALKRPTLVIFGPTDPTTTRPFNSQAEILRVPPDCAPCMLRECPIDHRCMTAVTPEMVFARVAARLSNSAQVG